MVSGEKVTAGWGQVLAVEDAVQAVLDAGLLLDHLSPMRDQLHSNNKHLQPTAQARRLLKLVLALCGSLFAKSA